MDHRSTMLTLPPGLPVNRYAAIVHAVLCALDVTGPPSVTSVHVIELMSDDDLTQAFEVPGDHRLWRM